MATSPSVFATLLLADARLPSGGHAHSAGIEPAFLAGVDAAGLIEVMRARLHTTTLVEAGTAVAARAVRVRGEELDRVEMAWEARTPSAAQRDASRVLARGYLRVASRLLPEDAVIAAWIARPVPPPRPCVLGVLAAGLRIGAADLARIVIYEDLQAGAAAVLKLEPRDPLDLMALVVALNVDVEDHLDRLSTIEDPLDIPAASAPLSEAWAEAHARSRRRLFRA